jgi:hypothetical protein
MIWPLVSGQPPVLDEDGRRRASIALPSLLGHQVQRESIVRSITLSREITVAGWSVQCRVFLLHMIAVG